MLEPFFSVVSSLECHIFQHFHKLTFCQNVLHCLPLSFFFATGFLILSGQAGVIFDGGFCALNSVGMSSCFSLFFVPLFVDCDSSKWLEHNS